jgi:3'-5' exoribonuclease
MKNILQLQKGEKVISFFKISSYSIKNGRNGDYCDFELSDNSGKISAKKWDYNPTTDIFQKGDIVKIEAKVDEFAGNLQLNIMKIRKTVESDNIDISEFIRVSSRNLLEMESEFKQFLDSITNKYLRKLLDIIFTKENWEKYSRIPAGISWHHAYLHGLLEHTLEIAKICDLMSKFHQEINRDLLISAALLHDFGKIEEIQGNIDFSYSDKGKLVGHIVLVSLIISENIKKIDNFPSELENQLLHLVLSHQGKLEFASPVVPKTLEAITLYHADELSAKTNAYKNAISMANNSESNWTQFIRLAETDLYKK